MGQRRSAHGHELQRRAAVAKGPAPVLRQGDRELARAYDFLSSVSPLILANQGKGTMTAVLLDATNTTQTFRLGNYNIEAKFWVPPAWMK